MNKIFIYMTMISAVSFASMTTHADSQKKFQTVLDGSQQVSDVDVNGASIPVKGLVTGAYGKAAFRLSHDRSTIHYVIKATNTSTPIIMAHLHLGPKGQNGPVMFWLYADAGVNPNFPRNDGPFPGKISGMLTAADFMMPMDSEGRVLISTFEDAIANIMNGNTYVNVHTAAHPSGELRGQFQHKHHDHDDHD